MKYRFALLLLSGAVAAASGYLGGIATASPAQEQKPSMTPAPPPLAVEVIAVDVQAKMLTIRQIAAIPAPSGKPVEVKLPVTATATGEKLDKIKAGDKVDVTCETKPIEPARPEDTPIVLTDCVRVVKIESTKTKP
jgi:Cu/Ag efflux protein CusF